MAAKIRGAEVSVTATVQTVAFADAMRHYTLVNEGTDSIFYRFDSNSSDTLSGDAAALKALNVCELQVGEGVVLDPPVSSIQVVCATSLTATLRILSGRLSSSVSVSVETGDLQIGAVEIKDHDGTDRAAVDSSNRLTVTDAQVLAKLIAAPATAAAQATMEAAIEADGLDVSAHHVSRTALTGADDTIALGAAYRNIRYWLDAGASPCYVAYDGAANSTDPLIDDGFVYQHKFDSDGISNLYIESTGSTGSINMEAW